MHHVQLIDKLSRSSAGSWVVALIKGRPVGSPGILFDRAETRYVLLTPCGGTFCTKMPKLARFAASRVVWPSVKCFVGLFVTVLLHLSLKGNGEKREQNRAKGAVAAASASTGGSAAGARSAAAMVA